MKGILTEKFAVVVLFIMIISVFTLAQKDSEKLDHLYRSTAGNTVSGMLQSKAQLSLQVSTSVVPPVF